MFPRKLDWPKPASADPRMSRPRAQLDSATFGRVCDKCRLEAQARGFGCKRFTRLRFVLVFVKTWRCPASHSRGCGNLLEDAQLSK